MDTGTTPAQRPGSGLGQAVDGSRPTTGRGVRPAGQGPAPWKRRTQFWLRWAHVYISLFSLLVMLFFGITGITLNHPSWFTGGDESVTFDGVLPAATGGADDVEFLLVSDFVRAQHGVKGEVADFGVDDGGQGFISYRAPGYSADLFFASTSGDYEITVNQSGFVGAMNALHQGRDSNPLWRLVIDISGLLLVTVAFTGLGIQLFMRKRRVSALLLSLVGTAVTVALMVMALG